MTTRYKVEDVAELIEAKLPEGMVELWRDLPQGTAATSTALAAARQASQVAIAQGLTMIEQKVTAVAGLAAGFRPEIMGKILDLPGVDVVAQTAASALTKGLNLSELSTAATKVLAEVLEEVGKRYGSELVRAEYIPAIGAVAQVVIAAVTTIVQAEKAWAAYELAQDQAIIDCAPPAYSAKLDEAQVKAAMSLMVGGDWTNLFMPESRTFDPDYDHSAWGPNANLPDSGFLDQGYRGFTCCISTLDGGRVIAPVGVGVGNRSQQFMPAIHYHTGPGFGLTPMVKGAPVQRAIVVPKNGGAFDPARDLPQLAALGQHAWHMLWSPGPLAFSVDGEQIADAWAEHYRVMRMFIAGNAIGIGGVERYDRKVCDEWPEAQRRAALRWLFTKIGMPDADNPDGIVSFSEALPVKAWNAYADFQHSLVDRKLMAYVDPDTCHPKWRKAVQDAHDRILEHATMPCEIDPADCPNKKFRERLKAERSTRGAQCFAVVGQLKAPGPVGPTEGPSLEPITGTPSPIPAMPKPARARPLRGSTSAEDTGGGGLLLAGAAVTAIAVAAVSINTGAARALFRR